MVVLHTDQTARFQSTAGTLHAVLVSTLSCFSWRANTVLDFTCPFKHSTQDACSALQAIVAGYEATSNRLKESGCKGQGTMATLAFLCGHHLTVATAGTSQAYLDTGSDLMLVRLLFCSQLLSVLLLLQLKP